MSISKYSFLFFMLLAFTHAYSQQDSVRIQQMLDKATKIEVSQPQEAIKIYLQTYDLSLKSKWYKGAFKSMQNIGFVHTDNGRYDLSIEYFQKALPFAKKINFKRGIATSYINTGNSFQYKGDYKKAIALYLKGIPILESIKDSSAVSQSYQNLAGLYANIKNLPLEEFYQKKALQNVNTANTEQKGLIYCDLVLFHLRQNQFEKAMQFLKKAEVLTKVNDSKYLAFYTIRNFGEYYRIAKQYKKAIPYYEHAVVLTDALNDAFQKNDLLYVLSGLYIKIGDYKTALTYGMQSMELAKTNKAKEIIYRSQKRLSVIYNALKQPQKAFDLLEQSYTLKDTFLTESHIKEMTLMQTQFETGKKDKAIAEQQIRLKKNQVELLEKQNQTIFALGGIFLIALLSLGIWLYFRQRQRIKDKEIIALQQQQEITKLEALIDGEEKERRRIAQELHDGINGDLSAIKFRISSLGDSDMSPEDQSNLIKVIEMIDQSCAQVRSISHNLMPASIVDFGLVATIEQYCSKIGSANAIPIDFQYFGDPAVLPKKVETVIYRIIQELINNIIKHAKATSALVQMNFHENDLFITVEDNGVGFDIKKIQTGIGLKNISSRVRYLNAKLDIDSGSNGTSFQINIDLKSLKND